MSAQPESLPLSSTAWESTTESRNDSESLPPRIRLKKKRKPFTEFRIIREPGSIQDTTELKPIPSPPWANDSHSLDSPLHLHHDTRGKQIAGPPSRQESCTYGRQSSAERSAQTNPDEDEDDIAVASAVLKKQLKRSGTKTNTFPPPARPSRKQKRYGCDICGQIFTRSGDVRRHKESRHDNSEGCRCPFCDRVLTRQDALQRHWDKYCRKKSKRHLDKQVTETQTRTIPSIPTPMYAPAGPLQTTSMTTTSSMEIGTGLDQSQVNYRYLNIFG